MSLLSTDLFAQVNYWAVIVVAIVTFFLGGLWYSPALFEQVWMNANGYTEAQVSQMQSDLGPLGFASTFLAYLVMAFVFALLLVAFKMSGVTGGLLLAVLLWLGFVASTSLTVTLFSVRPITTWLIDTGFHLSFLLVSGTILGLWR